MEKLPQLKKTNPVKCNFSCTISGVQKKDFQQVILHFVCITYVGIISTLELN